MITKIKRARPGWIITLGFASVILFGSVLLWLPITHQPNAIVTYVDALFTSTSAVCVTGLIAIDTAEHFNVFGRAVVATLIQIGGLGVTSVGAAFILLAQRKMGLRSRILIKEGLNLNSLQGVVRLVKAVLKLTLLFESIGFVLSFLVFVQDYPAWSAMGIALFHTISAFNNSGFDILGGLTNLIPYQSNVLLNLTTCGLIIFGGLGFCVIQEVWEKKKWHSFTMNTKIVLSMTAFLLITGTLLLKLSDDVTWLGAFFQSTSARTAGFSTYNLGTFSNTGLFVLIILMFIGASPGSTGGGIKTTTTFTIFRTIQAIATNKQCVAFHRRIPMESIIKAFVIMTLALTLVSVNTALICVWEPDCSFLQVLFEVVSGFGTVGLSTGITPHLLDSSKLLLCLTMFFGRLGPLTIACLWSYKSITGLVSYPEEKITIG